MTVKRMTKKQKLQENADRIKRLRLLRAEHGWTQAEAAKRIIAEAPGQKLALSTFRAWSFGSRDVPPWAIRLLELAVDKAKPEAV